MNRNALAAVVVVLALGAIALSRTGYDVSADEVSTIQGVTLPAASGGSDHAAFEWPAGVEYKLSDTGVEAFKASLAPLWTWAGDVGTYGDGQTQVRIVAQAGRVAGVEIIQNATQIADGCLEAQMLYGVSVDSAGVQAACAGMWTKEWAEAQGAQSGQGN